MFVYESQTSGVSSVKAWKQLTVTLNFPKDANEYVIYNNWKYYYFKNNFQVSSKISKFID